MNVLAPIAYVARTIERPRYFANDHSRDVLDINLRNMEITDGRPLTTSLDSEGFALVPHKSAFSDFTAPDYRAEIITLIQKLTGADFVAVNAPGILRFSEKSLEAGKHNNSLPARFAHVDITDDTAARFGSLSAPAGAKIGRTAHFNIWRAISGPPQDVPLAVCDASSVSPADLIVADAIFDEPGKPEWSFDGWVVSHSPGHRWHWFSDMRPDEVLVFKTNDSDTARAHCVPHVAFDHPNCPADAAARVSVEMRAIAQWLA